MLSLIILATRSDTPQSAGQPNPIDTANNTIAKSSPERIAHATMPPTTAPTEPTINRLIILPIQEYQSESENDRVTYLHSSCYLTIRISGARACEHPFEPIVIACQPILRTTSVVSNRQHLNRTRRFTEQHDKWKPFHSYAPDIGFLFNRVSVWRLTDSTHDSFKLRKIGSTEPGSFRFKIRN